MMQFLSPNDPRFMAETDALSIQNAINAAENGPIRTVCIPRVCARTGNAEWLIDESILLPSNITVILADAHLILKKDVYANIFRNKNMYTDISLKPEGKQTNIRIVGIDLRVGCSNIYINNITGRCGDDVVALSAFAASKEREQFLVEGMKPDIHDVTIRNVCAHTHYSLVALRNTDGAKIYRILIENIRDSGGEYGPINIVRIGENLYYRERTSILGETYDIRVRGVYSSTLCTVMLGGALKDSHISDIYAGGTSMSAVSTWSINRYHEGQKLFAWGGATLENVVFDNIHYNGSAGHCDAEWMNEPGTPYCGCALDFRRMREEDSFKNVVFRDIFAREGAELCIACDRVSPDIRN